MEVYPQGTLSGPKDFLVHINDLTTPCPIYKYVDDSTIFEICSTGDVSRIQESADIASKWSQDSDKTIITTKTHEMIIDFSNNRCNSTNLPNIVMSGSPIERTENAKVLGVTISANLTWNIHVENIIAKASKRVYMLYQLKRAGIGQTDLLRIYVSVVRPVLEYACPVWSTSLPVYLSDNIEIVQKRALRSIYPGISYNAILQNIKLPTLAARRKELCLIYFNNMKRSSHRLNHLLPPTRDVPYSLRSQTLYPRANAHTNRYNNSFIPWCLNNCQL